MTTKTELVNLIDSMDNDIQIYFSSYSSNSDSSDDVIEKNITKHRTYFNEYDKDLCIRSIVTFPDNLFRVIRLNDISIIHILTTSNTHLFTIKF